MTKKRKIAILKDMRSFIETRHIDGLCTAIARLWWCGMVSEKEYFKMRGFIDAFRPKDCIVYYFKKYARRPRIDWINQRIKELEDK